MNAALQRITRQRPDAQRLFTYAIAVPFTALMAIYLETMTAAGALGALWHVASGALCILAGYTVTSPQTPRSLATPPRRYARLAHITRWYPASHRIAAAGAFAIVASGVGKLLAPVVDILGVPTWPAYLILYILLAEVVLAALVQLIGWIQYKHQRRRQHDVPQASTN